MNDETPARLVESAADIRRGATRLARRLRAERSPDALSANKVGVLSYLYRQGPRTPGDVAAAEHQQPQSLTRVFTELEADGFVSRTRSARDRRQAMLAITPAGRAVLERDMAERDVWLAAALAALSETDVQVLRIAGALMDRIADAPARVVDRAHARRLTDMEKERGRIDNDAERADTG